MIDHRLGAALSQLVVYVDGFNLYHGLHDKHGRRFHWLDLVSLARSLRPQDQLVKVRYFTASVLDDSQALSRQDTYLNALVAHNGMAIDIVKGRYQKKQKSCRRCGGTWTHYEEKETDVNIAVSLVADIAQQTATSAMVISADSDLSPAIRTALTLNPRAHIMAAFPPKRFSNELKRLMPASFTIGRAKFAQAQLPQKVQDPSSGHTFERPAHWT
ncbi:NYN domain-containing protein [Streptomyces sp. NPDC056601]|uniref:NYN domain-containing protein n=1 Tax=Streptomyces sp. NPDC056601 TaxID=3345875 RepID=UPI0036B7A224